MNRRTFLGVLAAPLLPVATPTQSLFGPSIYSNLATQPLTAKALMEALRELERIASNPLGEPIVLQGPLYLEIQL